MSPPKSPMSHFFKANGTPVPLCTISRMNTEQRMVAPGRPESLLVSFFIEYWTPWISQPKGLERDCIIQCHPSCTRRVDENTRAESIIKYTGEILIGNIGYKRLALTSFGFSIAGCCSFGRPLINSIINCHGTFVNNTARVNSHYSIKYHKSTTEYLSKLTNK